MWCAPSEALPRLTIGAMLVLAAAGACAPATEPTSGGGVRSLRVGILADEGTLQPYTYVTGYPGTNLLGLVYDTLFILDARNEPRPWVALADDVSADGRTHTLTLRDDVRWHDGRPLTSDDVRFSYEFYRAHARSRWTPPVRAITGIETPSATTVVLHFAAPDPGVTVRLLPDVPIIPRHLWQHVRDPQRADIRIGSGPFRLVEYRAGQLYRFTANPEYFAGPPRIDELIVPVIPDTSTLFTALRTGEIHATTSELPPELVVGVQRASRLALASGAGYATTLLQFNSERAPWRDRRVREAVALAIDTRQLVDTLLLGRGTPGRGGWFHPSLAREEPREARVDLDRARRLLDEAGLQDGDGDGVREWHGSPVAPSLLVQANSPTRIRAAELIAAEVRRIGIDARVRSLDPVSVTAQVWPDFDVARTRAYDWTLFGWSAGVMADPLRVSELVHSNARVGTLNIGGFRSADADRLADELRVTTDRARQLTLLGGLDAIVAHEWPFVVLWYPDLSFPFLPAAYDGWTFQDGSGIFHKQSFLSGAFTQVSRRSRAGS